MQWWMCSSVIGEVDSRESLLWMSAVSLHMQWLSNMRESQYLVMWTSCTLCASFQGLNMSCVGWYQTRDTGYVYVRRREEIRSIPNKGWVCGCSVHLSLCTFRAKKIPCITMPPSWSVLLCVMSSVITHCLSLPPHSHP